MNVSFNKTYKVEAAAANNGKKIQWVYIYIHNAGISPTHVLFTRYYFIVFIINKEELGQQ